MDKINSDNLDKVVGGSSNGNEHIEIKEGNYLKNNTTEHYFKIMKNWVSDVIGVSCWKYNDGTYDKNPNALLHKVDIDIYYHSIDKSELPDWVLNLLG